MGIKTVPESQESTFCLAGPWHSETHPDAVFCLVGGIPTPLKNRSLSIGMTFPIYGKKTCSKPPTSCHLFLFLIHQHASCVFPVFQWRKWSLSSNAKQWLGLRAEQRPQGLHHTQVLRPETAAIGSSHLFNCLSLMWIEIHTTQYPQQIWNHLPPQGNVVEKKVLQSNAGLWLNGMMAWPKKGTNFVRSFEIDGLSRNIFLACTPTKEWVCYPLVIKHSCGQSQSLMGKSTISMVIFHSYFNITRG